MRRFGQADWDYGDNYLTLDKPLSTDNLGPVIEKKVQASKLTWLWPLPFADDLKGILYYKWPMILVTHGFLFTEIQEKQSLAIPIILALFSSLFCLSTGGY